MKNYTVEQVAKLNGKNYYALVKQLQRDSVKDNNKRKYPGAKKCECGHGWLIPEADLKTVNNKKGVDDAK